MLFLSLLLIFGYIQNMCMGSEMFEYSTDKPMFVLGGAHGDYDTVVQLLYKANIIDDQNKWIADEGTVLLQLGDVIGGGIHSDSLIDLFIDLRIQANSNKSEVILLMGKSEYVSGTRDLWTDNDTISMGGVDNTVQLFSEENSKYRKYIQSLKMVVMVNDVLFSHVGLIIQDCDYFCNGIESEFVHNCLQRINDISQESLPSFDCDEGEYVPASPVTHLLNRSILRHILVYDDMSLSTYCKQHKQFLHKFNAAALFIGHERGTPLCDNTLVFVERQLYDKYKTHHDAYITRVNFNNKHVQDFEFFRVRIQHK
eukprot:GHVR01173868.1.p1 GENE.GHVR01173868.1~~GHVR01173868.1.p1  ORF type:complete len:322 (+),score=64.27 GHVR01173868.1:32-967(+)